MCTAAKSILGDNAFESCFQGATECSAANLADNPFHILLAGIVCLTSTLHTGSWILHNFKTNVVLTDLSSSYDIGFYKGDELVKGLTTAISRTVNGP